MDKIEKLYELLYELSEWFKDSHKVARILGLGLVEYIERQPQKQPEDKMTAGDVFQLKRLEESAKDYKKLKELIDKPEKQEEWREEFEGWFYKTFTNNKENYWIDVSYEGVDDIYKQIEDFISQLLSEEFEKGVIKGRLEALPITKELLSKRTFNKEELEYIEGACYMWGKEANKHNPIKEEFRDTSKIDAFNKKLSKLLKEAKE